jgi:hypothetical protein
MRELMICDGVWLVFSQRARVAGLAVPAVDARAALAMTTSMRRAAALVAGSVTAVAIGVVAVLLARQLWPAYAAAEPTKQYSSAMLITRLLAGALCTASASFVATRIANDSAVIGWWLGGLFLAVSLPNHVWFVWADYPAWYHLMYLSYLLPVAGFIGSAVYRVRRDGRARV